MTSLPLLSFGLALLVTGLFFFYFNRQKRRRKTPQFHHYESPMGPIAYKYKRERGPGLKDPHPPHVLLLHGLGCSSYCWRHTCQSLSPHYQVITMDLWGFGKSSKAFPKEMSLDAQKEVIQGLLDHLKIPKLHVVGHSMGGQLAIWLKLNDQRVDKVVALTPAIHPQLVSNWVHGMRWISRWTPLVYNPTITRKVLLGCFSNPRFITEELLENYHAPYKDPEAHRSFAAAFNIIRDPRVFENLERLDGDSLILWGAGDQVISPQMAQKISEKLPMAPRKTHPWAGHLLMEEDHPWLVKQILLHFKS